MGKFISKSIFLLVTTLVVIYLIRLPHKDIWELKKVTRVTDLVNDFDGFFIGSSLGMKHIDPIQFDKEVGNGMNTINMAVAGCTMPESFNAYYQLLDRLEKSEETKYVFFELQQVRTIPDFNLGTARTINMVNPKNYLTSMNYLLKKSRYSDLWNYTHPFIQHLTGVNTFKDILKEEYKSYKRGAPDPTNRMPRGRGYVANKAPKIPVEETKWSQIRKDLDTGILDSGDKVILNKLNRMIADGKKKNVHLYLSLIHISEPTRPY